MNDIDRIVGNNIRKRREKKGLTRRQLADAASMMEDDIVDFEGGVRRPHVRTLAKIAQVLGCEPADLQIDDGA